MEDKHSKNYTPVSFESILCATLLLVTALVGIFSNSISALVLTQNKSFRNSFGQLTTLHAVANTGVLLIFAFWSVPLIIVDIPESLHWLNRRIGQLSLLFTEIAFHTCLFISLNRLAAIAAPSFYRRYFHGKLTAAIIIFICLYSLAYDKGCDFHFDSSTRVWSFSQTACGAALSFYVDLVYNVSVFGIIAILDVTTLCFLKKANKTLTASTDEVSRRRNKEIRFFLQALTNTGVYAFMLVCFHIFAHLSSSDFISFLSTTGVWCFSHACGGVILVAFNREIRKPMKSPKSFFRLMVESTTSPIMVTRGKKSTTQSK